MTAPCPVCSIPARFVVRADSSLATYNCDAPECRMGGFSEHVWPEPDGGFTRIQDLEDRRLAAAIATADISNPQLALVLRREQERRYK